MGRDSSAEKVAKHFFEKYGSQQAMDIISLRINGDGAQQTTEFWLDVIECLKVMSADETLSPSPEAIPLQSATYRQSLKE